MSPIPQALPTKDPHVRLRFPRKLFSSSSRMDAVCADQPRNPLDFPATSPLPHPLRMTPDKNSRSIPAPPNPLPSALPQSSNPAYIDYRLGGPFTQVLCRRPSSMSLSRRVDWYRYAAAGAPRDDDSLIRDEDYVSPPPSPNPEQHGRFCFCF
ncbi:uncharacterized protein HD556DRAFT_1312063 [Suillus plorans]|uniref:Uncharacterized protein n=1 Tax=Suillus plorans TaxID=116603 RepID=A0A9P7AGT5_9AGAM|nr:uncharacterized protein HD556DRAFT_1312063 [Suillus plorans]KAG1788488.1 hypothetical protein HD556DRAFT_1312063 [Suillus plorans]